VATSQVQGAVRPARKPISAYVKGLVAPYKRFRKTRFYDTTFIGGTYTGDIIGCPWTCDHCWSHFGWTHDPSQAEFELNPTQVVDKLMKGMIRNGQQACRISGGEPSMYWDHMMGVIDVFMERVAGKRMTIAGETGPDGVPMYIVFETNGSLTSLERIDEVQERYGEESFHVLLHFGIKATDPELLAALNGMAPEAAKAAHERQMKALVHVASKTNLDLHVSVFDAFSDEQGVEQLRDALELARPGASRHMTVARYKRNYGNAAKFHTPKRHRARA